LLLLLLPLSFYSCCGAICRLLHVKKQRPRVLQLLQAAGPTRRCFCFLLRLAAAFCVANAAAARALLLLLRITSSCGTAAG
jgi:hypothetical protein